MDHLTKFNNETEYNAQKGSLVLPNVSLIASTDELKVLEKPAHFLDYLHSTGIVDNIASDDVVGICVMPSSHYGKARYMSIVNMSTSSTSGTTSDEHLKWRSSGSGTDLDRQTTQFVGMPLLDSGDTTIGVWDYNDDYYALIATDRLHGDYQADGIVEGLSIPNNWDQTAVYWYNDEDSNNRYCPSPFLANGLLNPDYCRPWPNVLSDVDGIANTNALLAKSSTNYPAAKACHDFAPGYRNGEWYLPAMGELAYLQVRWGAINDKLSALESAGCDVAYLPENDDLWSSSEFNDDDAWGLGTDGGNVSSSSKGYGVLVRAFLA